MPFDITFVDLMTDDTHFLKSWMVRTIFWLSKSFWELKHKKWGKKRVQKQAVILAIKR